MSAIFFHHIRHLVRHMRRRFAPTTLNFPPAGGPNISISMEAVVAHVIEAVKSGRVE